MILFLLDFVKPRSTVTSRHLSFLSMEFQLMTLYFACFSLFPSLTMYTVRDPCISQNGALIICKNISANQINIVQGQMRAALPVHTQEKRGQLLTNWFDVKEEHSFSRSGKTLTVRLAITPPPYLQLQLPLTPNYVLNLHSNGPRYATFPSAPLCIWLSISL